MIKRTFKILFSLSICFCALFSCTQDDICTEGDTPLLIIVFFDAENPTERLSVPQLRIVENSTNEIINTFIDRSSGLDSIAIPLQINAPETEFTFIIDSENDGDIDVGNLDILSFNYRTEQRFISTGCGFVANFNDLSQDLTPDGNNWIQAVSVLEPNVEDLNSIHVQILH